MKAREFQTSLSYIAVIYLGRKGGRGRREGRREGRKGKEGEGREGKGYTSHIT